jgi:hypothetical protein
MPWALDLGQCTGHRTCDTRRADFSERQSQFTGGNSIVFIFRQVNSLFLDGPADPPSADAA